MYVTGLQLQAHAATGAYCLDSALENTGFESFEVKLMKHKNHHLNVNPVPALYQGRLSYSVVVSAHSARDVMIVQIYS